MHEPLIVSMKNHPFLPNFRIELLPGVTVVAGPNGCGKTLLLRTLAFLAGHSHLIDRHLEACEFSAELESQRMTTCVHKPSGRVQYVRTDRDGTVTEETQHPLSHKEWPLIRALTSPNIFPFSMNTIRALMLFDAEENFGPYQERVLARFLTAFGEHGERVWSLRNSHRDVERALTPAMLTFLSVVARVLETPEHRAICFDDFGWNLAPIAVRELLHLIFSVARERSLYVLLSTVSPQVLDVCYSERATEQPAAAVWVFDRKDPSPTQPVLLREHANAEWNEHFAAGDLYEMGEIAAPSSTALGSEQRKAP